MTDDVVEFVLANMNELEKGDKVAFGRAESHHDPAVGVICKVNRQTYRVELTQPWIQKTRTYHTGAKFRVAKVLVWRYLCEADTTWGDSE